MKLPIPCEHHKYILGKGGKNLQQLESNTGTKITIPKNGSETIVIIGIREDVDRARHEIQCISDNKVRSIVTTTCCEKCNVDYNKYKASLLWLHFFKGKARFWTTWNSQNLSLLYRRTKPRDVTEEYKVKINIPPPSVNKDEVTISGDKEGVAMAKEEIMKIYKEKVKNNNYPVLLFFSSSLFCINCIITLWDSLSGFLDDFRTLLVTLFVWFSGTKNNHGFHRSQKIPTQIRYWPQETSFKWDTCSDRYEFASLCMWDLQLQGWS